MWDNWKLWNKFREQFDMLVVLIVTLLGCEAEAGPWHCVPHTQKIFHLSPPSEFPMLQSEFATGVEESAFVVCLVGRKNGVRVRLLPLGVACIGGFVLLSLPFATAFLGTR